MSLNAEIVKLFYDLWDETRTAREYLVANEPPATVDKVPRANARDVQQAMLSLNRIGHLIASGLLDEQFVTSLIGKEVIRIGQRMRPFLEEERTKRKDPAYDEFAEQLIERCGRA